jgi:predicted naringenin-chalcone synthase
MPISAKQPSQRAHSNDFRQIPRGIALVGWGTATPNTAISQAEAANIASGLSTYTERQKRLLPVLYRQSGVRRRHSVLLEPSVDGGTTQSFYQTASHSEDHGPSTSARMQVYEREVNFLAHSACAKALASAETPPADITDLVTVSCSGFAAPGIDIALIHDLELSADVSRTHVGFMGCHGLLNGLRVARAYTVADPQARVLLCAAELCSLHHKYGWSPDQIVANALFADGAAAIVCSGDNSESTKATRLIGSGSTVIPETTDLMQWKIRDHGFEMTLSPRVPDTIRTHLRPWLENWLAGFDLSLPEIAAWAIHPGGPRILQACVDALDLPPQAIEPSQQILAEYGNMSSPTVLFILDRLVAEQLSGPCIMLAFGPGLTVEAALLNL